jgi:hypothetical protein
VPVTSDWAQKIREQRVQENKESKESKTKKLQQRKCNNEHKAERRFNHETDYQTDESKSGAS